MRGITSPAIGGLAKIAKWRGIKTSDVPKNEERAVTIKNRLGQLSFSLPRIDDGKRWAGFPGLAGTARKIAKIVPDCAYYVEPFAGAARVYQEYVKRRDKESETRKLKGFTAVLNEKSDFIHEWLTRELNYGQIIEQLDFADCIKKYDSEKTFFLIDPPWVKSFYDQGFATFDRKSVIEYEEEILDICKTIKGKFIITTRTERVRMRKAKYHHKTIRSVYKVSGKLPLVLLTANFDLRRRHEP